MYYRLRLFTNPPAEVPPVGCVDITQAATKLGAIHASATPITRTYTITSQAAPPTAPTFSAERHITPSTP